MKLWLLENPSADYDTFAAAVVAAEDEQAARRTHPGTGEDPAVEWREDPGAWFDVYRTSSRRRMPGYEDWPVPREVNILLIGKAAEGVEAGVICADYMRP